MKTLRGFLAIALSAWTLANARAAAAPADTAPVADSVNRFGFSLFSRLAAENLAGSKPAENLFISPASIAWAFDMLLNGAEGPTLEAMTKTLEAGGLSLAQLNAANLALRQALESADPKVEIAIANGLFGKVGMSFLPAFLETVRQHYAARLAPLDGVETVNAWVNEKTRGKIPTILPPGSVTPQTILVLVNAIYFKGLWDKPFPKAATAPQPFHLLDGGVKPHPMMSRSTSFRYYEDAALQAIRLPYGSGRLGMIVVLPAKGSSLKALVAGLDAGRWRSLVAGLKNRPGKLVLPRFKAEYSAELSRTLKAMGMELPFTEQADFKKLAQVPPGWWVKISAVFHKTFVEVSEEGTEAAAATAITMLAGSAPPPPEAPFTMVVDRPFVAAIEDGATGLVLFLGAIVAPQ